MERQHRTALIAVLAHNTQAGYLFSVMTDRESPMNKRPKNGQGDKIRTAREARGWSQAELGEKVGTSQQTIDKLERGIVSHSRYLRQILSILQLSEGEAANAPIPLSVGKEINHLLGQRDLPVYGAAEGGDGALIISVEPVDYVRRPAPLENVKDGYGLIVLLDSMVPEFRPGDTALIHPHLPPVAGKACVFYADDGAGQVRTVIKSFVRQTATHWHVEQWNPPKKFSLDKKEWQRCHRVVGRYDSR